MSPPDRQIHATIDGPIVMIGFGSIGKGTLPLIERHFSYDKDRMVVIDPYGGDRERLDARRRNPSGITAVSCCGANPGMVSWFVKQALLDIARDLDVKSPEPKTREEWARL